MSKINWEKEREYFRRHASYTTRNTLRRAAGLEPLTRYTQQLTQANIPWRHQPKGDPNRKHWINLHQKNDLHEVAADNLIFLVDSDGVVIASKTDEGLALTKNKPGDI